jgi:hypothetical protein
MRKTATIVAVTRRSYRSSRNTLLSQTGGFRKKENGLEADVSQEAEKSHATLDLSLSLFLGYLLVAYRYADDWMRCADRTIAAEKPQIAGVLHVDALEV